MSNRTDERDADWPLRPWLMAAICAGAGLVFNLLTDVTHPATPSAARQAGATFVVIAAVSFVMTVEQRRWLWSLAFALGWGAVVALVGWFTASYNSHPTIFEWPFLSGLFAVLLAAPLFQTVRDECAWRFPYARLHRHAWTDAVIGAASLGFVGVTFLLAWLIAGLFDLIGIDLVKDLLGESWFGWMLAGFAFGAAVGLLRQRDALVATLQRLVMVVLGVLAPVLAAALILFLASLPFTGLGGLWDSSIPATGLMLLAGAGAVLLANAVIGNGDDDRASSRVLRMSALLWCSRYCRWRSSRRCRSASGSVSTAGPPNASGERSRWPSPSLTGLPAGGRLRRAARDSTICCARSRPGSRSDCAGWPCSSLCRSSISGRFRQVRRLRASPAERSTRRNSTGGRWRSTSVPPAASGWRKSRAGVRPTSAGWRWPH